MVSFLTAARTRSAAVSLYLGKNQFGFVFLFPLLLGKDSNAINARVSMFKGMDFFLGKVFYKNIIRDYNGFFLLDGHIAKTHFVDVAEIFLLLNSSCDTARIHFRVLP